jgi:CubicO group peptidase (beta-lactamase class C family)
MAREHISGLALGVYRDGRILKAQGYGLANLELNVPVKPESIFQSGSLAKQFTATAVMMLVEEGNVGLEDSVTKYFPEAPLSWQPIKVRNLLSHTSGLTEYDSEDKTRPGGPINLHTDMTERELLMIIESFPLDFPPGEKWGYCDTNYFVLGVLIHRVTGKLWGDFLQARIFEPLGMTNTRIISERDIVPNRSAGYKLVKGELKNKEWDSATFNSAPGYGLYFNILDLAKWDAALYTQKLLRRETLNEMWTVARLNNGDLNWGNYGFGWVIDTVNGHKVVGHGGFSEGFTAHIARYIEDRLTVVVLTNLGTEYAAPDRIARRVAGLYEPALMQPKRKPIEDKEPLVTALVRSALEKMARGKTEHFTPSSEMWSSDIEDWTAYLKGLGELTSLELLERKQQGAKRRYVYRVKFREDTLVLALVLDADNEISGLDETAEE